MYFKCYENSRSTNKTFSVGLTNLHINTYKLRMQPALQAMTSIEVLIYFHPNNESLRATTCRNKPAITQYIALC